MKRILTTLAVAAAAATVLSAPAQAETMDPTTGTGLDVVSDAISMAQKHACNFALNEAARFADFWVLVPAETAKEIVQDADSQLGVQSLPANLDGETGTILPYLRCKQLHTDPDMFR